ncbi:MAG: hypothetical protein RBS73_11380 [Prolixibacteraceae bacterium]|nr:hypothetical protein [Prolixibacteraceae bacterium]
MKKSVDFIFQKAVEKMADFFNDNFAKEKTSPIFAATFKEAEDNSQIILKVSCERSSYLFGEMGEWLKPAVC